MSLSAKSLRQCRLDEALDLMSTFPVTCGHKYILYCRWQPKHAPCQQGAIAASLRSSAKHTTSSDQIFASGPRVSGRTLGVGQCVGGPRSSISPLNMYVAPKQRSEFKHLATRPLARVENLRDRPRAFAAPLDGARELADRGEIDVALTVVRVAELDRLRAAAAKSLETELRSVLRSPSQLPP